jgi:hypothetical protein
MASSSAAAQKHDSGAKPKRNNIGTGFFILIILLKLIWGSGNVVIGLAPDYLMDYFEMEASLYIVDETSYYSFLALGIILIAQVVVSVLAIWKPDFFDKNSGWKGSPFILSLVVGIFVWVFTYSGMALISNSSSILDIFVFSIFLVKPTSWLARHLRPFKPEVQEESIGSAAYPQKPIQTV